MTLKEFLSGIANAIRGVEGSSGSIPAASFAERIAALKASFKLQSKTVVPSTAAKTVTADDGYDGLEQVTVSAIPTVAQAAPAITVSSDGVITATVTQAEGYVKGGTTSKSKMLSAQEGKTVTPGTSDQVAVESQKYTTGPVSVAGDSNLVSANIANDVSIFGITGILPRCSRVGFTELVDSDKNCTIDFTNYVISVSPESVLTYYDASRITAVENLALVIQCSDSTNKVYHKLLICSDTSNKYYPRKLRFMYCCWSGSTEASNDSSTIEMIRSSVTKTVEWYFDETTKKMLLDVSSGSSGYADMREALDFIADNCGDGSPLVGGTITWSIT